MSKEKVREFFDRACVNFALMVLILISVVLTTAEMTLRLKHDLEHALVISSDIITFVFIIELSLRFWAAPSKRRFLAAFWLDIISVLPAFRVFRVARVLRMLRILRLFRAGILVNRMQSMTSAVRENYAEYMGIAIVMIVILVFSITALMHFEGPGQGRFVSINDTFWWVVISLTSGQPADGMPQTTASRIVSVLLVLTGSVAFALFTGLVSAVITQKFRSSMEVHLMDISDLRDHTVICGWNRLGRLIVEQLQSDPVNRRDYIVIIAEMDKAPEFDPRLVAGEMILHLNGDFTRVDVLTRANVARASVAILLADDTKERTDQARDALTVLAALTIEKLQPSIFTCAELLSKENEHHLRMAKVDEVIITSEVAGRLLGTAARNRGIPGIVGDLLMSARRSCDVSTVDLPAALEGKSFLDALFHYKEQSEGIIVGVQRDGSTVFNPPHDFILRRGDRLELLASDPSGNTRA